MTPRMRSHLHSLPTLALLAASLLGGLRPPLAAADRISIGVTPADAGAAEVAVPVSVTHDSALHGFSVSLRYDPTLLTLLRVDPGSAISDIGGKFFSSRLQPTTGSAIFGAIFSLSAGELEPFELIELEPSPDQPQEIAVLHFSVSASVRAGEKPIELVSGLGDPPVQNSFSVAGRTVTPELRHGAVSVINHHLLALQDTRAVPGSRAEVWALGSHPSPLEGFSVSLTYDKSVLSFAGATAAGSDAARAIAPDVFEFFAPQDDLNFSPDRGRISVAVVLDYTSPFAGQQIPASPDEFRSLVRISFDVANNPALVGTSTQLTLHDIVATGGQGVLNNLFIVGVDSFPPELTHGKIDFVAGITFRRGFVNRDSVINIADAINILGHIFIGETAPPCVKAADINDDGLYNIGDAIGVLGFLFVGTAPPRPPYEACGVDPTPDTLSCLGSPQCGT